MQREGVSPAVSLPSAVEVSNQYRSLVRVLGDPIADDLPDPFSVICLVGRELIQINDVERARRRLPFQKEKKSSRGRFCSANFSNFVQKSNVQKSSFLGESVVHSDLGTTFFESVEHGTGAYIPAD